ncbi:MAG: hypothetical protein NTX09_01015, partial [Verrucomicrobia bacterium]|nr:hypothetical protein [Verrucomicrobiota bacterium]
FTRHPNSVISSSIQILRSEWNVSHILFFEIDSNSKDKLTAVLYRIESDFSLIEFSRVPVYLDQGRLQSNRSNWFLKSLALLSPNNVSTGFSDTNVSLQLDDNYKQLSTNSKGALPPIISSISFSKVEHPMGYSTFDYSGTVFPGSYLFAINQYNVLDRKNRILPEDPNEPNEVFIHIEAYGACLNLNGQGSLFTPLGILYAGIGWGGLTRVPAVPSPCSLRRRAGSWLCRWSIPCAKALFR